MDDGGWTAPEQPASPNFTRFVSESEDLHEVATTIARTFLEVYGVHSTDTWVVSPPEFGHGEAGLEPFDVLDPEAHDSNNHAIGAGMVFEEQVVEGFSPYVQEHIGWYVYLLRDPRDDVVFYVGKAKGNRVFAHAQAALALEDKDDEVSLKLARIRAIHRAGLKVQTEIIRHHISSEAAAYAIEAAVIDTFRAIRRPLANMVLGHQHALHGWASTSTVASIYDAPPLPDITEPVILLKIPKLWTPAMCAADLFEATRGWWKVGYRALGARYALAVNRGVTRAAYRIEYWRERVPTDRDYAEDDNGKRLGFWGPEAPELSHLVNRRIRGLPQPAGSPVVYLNLGPNAAPLTPLYRGAEARAKAEEESSR